ncbi:hypothetical protein B5F40_13275 [Gordonibacter sp. An230]|nr:hypothetical protein B5F40_13275 [Gordonibacter sp. An230]
MNSAERTSLRALAATGFRLLFAVASQHPSLCAPIELRCLFLTVIDLLRPMFPFGRAGALR